MAGQRIGREAGKKSGAPGDVVERRELAVDSLLQHDVLDHIIFADAELFCLLRNLLFHEWRFDKSGADHVRADAMLGAFLGDDLREADQSVLGCDVGLLEL